MLPSLLPHTLTYAQKQAGIAANVQRQQTVTPLSIFLNNYLIAGFSIFPIAGWIFTDIVMFKTGIVVASYSLPSYWIFTSVFGWIELSVYSFCLLQGCRIFMFYLKRKSLSFWPLTAKTVLVTLSISGLVLMFSAIWEYVIIINRVLI